MKRMCVMMIAGLLAAATAEAGLFSKSKKEKSFTPVQKAAPRTVAPDWASLKSAEETIDTAPRRFNANKIGLVHPGMSYAQVKSILGDDVLVGYKDIRTADGSYQKILFKNPYRAEVLRGLGKQFEVYFFMTDVKASDGKVSDEELTPIVFDGDELIGKDWDFYRKLKSQLEGSG